MSDGPEVKPSLDQGDLDKLLAEAQASVESLEEAASDVSSAEATPAPDSASTAQTDVQASQTASEQASDRSVKADPLPSESQPAPASQGFELPPLGDESRIADSQKGQSIGVLSDVDLDVRIELGQASMAVEEVLHLESGSVVELDKLAGDPVDVFVNDRLVARGEILVVNENFCVRISEILNTPP
jgi:flagellar motor switch protein FliN/FliY